ncbi:uncharacterized protein SPPG_07069 [Spizellomyces punctatus DAOM BR117]|uniref:UDENN domain-containing protein n=1 Tax=Spizellomyces punctatus (strain DAOM BR117) TaxID=645134 RepID=A0A0L0H7W6_SPIPD|nr:uncharacterized protein SPPG_07069 [Spizellomyces punctatus DAOM BR117]KNC97600.1 hypothetical protein SPPG_07069 [Spizellomyces punctatus DAOM BR117]|eukprot:XP_016605640.1 hypothetical protein SPPG_07069 [Spizellomyces punctatus DAOM BR117]
MDVSSLFAHVDHVLVAEFDIDKGSSLSYQYPLETGTDVHMLADLMLPDGAHLREEDWTMFFLNQPIMGQESGSETLTSNIPDHIRHSLLPASAYQYDANRGWSTIGPEPTIQLQLAEKCTIWDDRCTQVVTEFNLSEVEYRRNGPLCSYLFVRGQTWAIRFCSEDDEIYFLDAIDRVLDGAVENTTELPPPPPQEQNRKPLLYVLNLVRTKHISGVRRGARVKAMAIASRHNSVHAFKPLLLLALDKYFTTPSIDVVTELYKSINAMDVSLMPRLSTLEKKILRASEDRSLFEEKFQDAVDGMPNSPGVDRLIRSGSVDTTASFASARQGRESAVPQDGQPVLVRAGTQTKPSNKDRHYFETKVAYGGIKVPIRIPLTAYSEEIGDFSVSKFLSSFGQASAINPPPGPSKDTPPPSLQWKNGAPFHWHPHLDSGPQTHPIIVLMNALLSEKRVLFLGDKRPSGEVAHYVLAACALAGGGGSILRGFAERCFPYVSLAGLDYLLAVPGYIAGVTNPVFEEQPAWWDVLCNINTGKITVSPLLTGSASNGLRDSTGKEREKDRDWMRAGSWEGDNEFIQEALLAVLSHTGELHVRQRFHDYIRRTVDVCAAYEIDTFGTSSIAVLGHHVEHAELGFGPFFNDSLLRKRETFMLGNRIEGWRQSKSYRNCQQDFQVYLHRRAIKSLDVRYLLSALRSPQTMMEPIAIRTFLGLQDALAGGDDDMVIELLSLLPQSQGGVFPIAVGLFHARWELRRACVRLLRRIGWHKVGQKFIGHLNAFVQVVYQRIHGEFYRGEVPPGVDLLHVEWNEIGSRVSSIEGFLRRDSNAKTPRNVTMDDSQMKPVRETTQPTPSSPPHPSTPPRQSSTTPPTALSPVVKRLLQQQQQKQEQLRAKLTALKDDGVFVTDIMNPEFGKEFVRDDKVEVGKNVGEKSDVGKGEIGKGEEGAPLAPKRGASMPKVEVRKCKKSYVIFFFLILLGDFFLG